MGAAREATPTGMGVGPMTRDRVRITPRCEPGVESHTLASGAPGLELRTVSGAPGVESSPPHVVHAAAALEKLNDALVCILDEKALELGHCKPRQTHQLVGIADG